MSAIQVKDLWINPDYIKYFRPPDSGFVYIQLEGEDPLPWRPPDGMSAEELYQRLQELVGHK